ncbi:MAG: sigma 54-interacting transcriptional regulator [Pseudomonadota bacterium]
MSFNFVIINEDQDFATSLSQILELDNHIVTCEKTPKSGLDKIDAGFAGIVVVDHAERKMPVAQLVADIAQLAPQARVIVTASPEQVMAAKSMSDANLIGVLAKPIDFDELDSLLTIAPATAAEIDDAPELEAEPGVEETVLAEAVTLKETVPVVEEPVIGEPAPAAEAPSADAPKPAKPAIPRDPLVVCGHSDIAKRLHKEWQALLGIETDVALVGDKGVGKSSFIRALNLSGPMVEVQCAKLDRKTSDRKLFGQDQKGLNLSEREESFLDQALGGTLALYDIEQLPPSTQEALQRVIKTRQEMAAAGNAKLFSFRLIATSTFDLRELAAQRKFSPVLLNALDPVFVSIPPLRERGIDPVMMFEMAMQLASTELQVECPEMTPKLASALSAYNWPGNLRELRQSARNYVMEKAGVTDTKGEPGEVISLANTRRA